MSGDRPTNSARKSSPRSAKPPPDAESLDVSKSTAALGFWASLRAILGYRSFSVYLVTSWILGVFGVIINYYIMYYLRDILFDYILVGVVLAFYMTMELVMRFLGGYLGDNANRKLLSVLTMLVSGLALFVFAFANTFLWLMVGCLVLSLSTLFASGSTSYIYENTPREHAGRAMGLLQTSSGFGLLGLALITWLLGSGMAFVPAVQLMYILGGICYLLAAAVRAIFLARPKPIARTNRAANTAREFFRQNWQAIRYLAAVLPVFVAILVVDAISDGLYNFVNMYYLNEALMFSIGEISLMLIMVLAFSIPLSITVGGFFDRHGSRRAITVVYSVMPLCLVLLLIAPLFPSWFPLSSLTTTLVTAYPILVPLLSTAFIATACKRINDILWWTLILTFVRRVVPPSETAKMISIMMIIVMIAGALTPIPAAFVYTLYGAVPVLLVSLILNLAILAILVTRSIEPRPRSDKASETEQA